MDIDISDGKALKAKLFSRALHKPISKALTKWT